VNKGRAGETPRRPVVQHSKRETRVRGTVLPLSGFYSVERNSGAGTAVRIPIENELRGWTIFSIEEGVRLEPSSATLEAGDAGQGNRSPAFWFSILLNETAEPALP